MRTSRPFICLVAAHAWRLIDRRAGNSPRSRRPSPTGQARLMARRLVEAGAADNRHSTTPNRGQTQARTADAYGWDTHNDFEGAEGPSPPF